MNIDRRRRELLDEFRRGGSVSTAPDYAERNPMTIDIPEGYESLGLAIGEAVAQASRGKGADRHAEKGEPFSDQLIMSIPKRLGEGGECFCLGQALKKICESRRLAPAHARAELLGAINYLAAAWSLLGGGESVLAPEAPKAAGNVCLDFAERVVSLMKEAGVREVSFAGPGARICADGTVEGLHFTTEDADAPRFRKGELVEFRSRDGKWKPASFMHMDGGYAVLVSGGEKFEVLAFDVRPAEKV